MSARARRVVKLIPTLFLLPLGYVSALSLSFASASTTFHPNFSGDVGPVVSTTEPVNVIVCSDLKARSNVLLTAFADAGASHADAVIVGGDLTERNSEFEYRYATCLLHNSPVPTFEVFGNHEAWDRESHIDRERFRRYFGPTQSWFRIKNVLFVAIDTADYDFPEERAVEAERFFVEHGAGTRRRVLVTHVPPLVGKHREDRQHHEKELSEKDSARLIQLAERQKVDLVLGSHFHGFAREERNSVLYVVTGGGGAPLDGPDEFYHYLRVKLDDAGVAADVVKVSSPHGREWVNYLLLRNAQVAIPVLAASFVISLAIAWRSGKARPVTP